MSKISCLALAGVLLIAACSRKAGDTVTLKLEIPGRAQLAALAARNARLNGRDIPTVVTDFNCLAINVVGPGITESGPAPARASMEDIKEGKHCTYPGVMSELVPAETGGEVEVKVPGGPGRVIQVLGLISPNGCGADRNPRTHFNRRPSANNDPEFPGIYEVGRATQDLYSSTTVNIANSYDPDQLKEVRCMSACSDEMKANSPFATASADGTPSNPHLICTGTQLDAIAATPLTLNYYYELLEDLDLTASPPTPIGDTTDPFTGTFNGNGHKITGYVLTTGKSQPYGIFGQIGATGNVTGLHVIDGVFVTGNASGMRGLLAGINKGSINKCSASGTISANSQNTGILVGYNEGTITDSFSSGTLTISSGPGRGGGLVGKDLGGTILRGKSSATVSSVNNAIGLGGLVGSIGAGSRIESSSASGNVSSGASNIGGLVGESLGGTIEKSVANGNVSGSLNVGGLVGLLENATVTESAAFGTVSGTTDSAGGLVGHFEHSAFNTTVVTNCAAYGAVSGSGSVGTLIGQETAASVGTKTVSLSFSPWAPASPTIFEGLIGSADAKVAHGSVYANGNLVSTPVTGETRIATANLKTQSSYADFNFTSIWKITEGSTFPELRAIPSLQMSRAALPTNRREAGKP